ncbi:hypothetical protein SAMN05428945_3792 [Streptomyces sp. 2224.1]|nr:hypothetical protein BX261_1548 [Streptomyces sp. 2321.6]SDR53700.1 hypothetical protein SAMN05216511_5670 [Streptomyces sp. KS_16]SEC25324.1 hypothetical protein SAMN05428940_1548 [Streptomyces sp. 2133.1]SED08699.1 hypothetical protein SAMN05428945_3792 [Streptomyces sp. 2224.1]SEF06054.1 hypothetical protein SAMN05428954_5734 [Streptomyces sp. 2112.3]SNC66141.1 hypothetical protein SAMN06272741_1544 [Streptomyces sp. 2114.4]
MVGACIMPCRAPVAQSAALRGGVRRRESARACGRCRAPVRARAVAAGGAPRARTVAAGGRAVVVVLWRPDSDRRSCLSVLDSTSRLRDR